jgi:glutaconate CoA-transferase subunit B
MPLEGAGATYAGDRRFLDGDSTAASAIKPRCKRQHRCGLRAHRVTLAWSMIDNLTRGYIFCGTGISMLAATAAKNINAPNSVIFFETEAIDSLLEELPLAVGDPRIMYWSASNASLLEAFATMQNRHTGDKVIAVVGAAQIDMYGNLNTTCIGDYLKPDIRFAGSGGGCDVASFVPRCIAFMQHEKRKFVRKLDYLTSPGQLFGKGSREKAGLRSGGITVVITNLYDNQTN